MDTKEIINQLSKEVIQVLNESHPAEIDKMSNLILNADNIFIQGNGRSKLVGQMIAMRLMHSGYKVHVVGETTTPSFTKDDLLIVLSGSGKGSTLHQMVAKAQDIGGKTALVTATEEESITQQFDTSIFVKASTKHNHIETIQPLGNQFDQAMHLILDALVINLNIKTNQSNDELKKRHFNLE